MFWFVFGHLRLQGERFPLYLWRFHGSSDVCLPSVVEPRKSRSNLWATRSSSAYHEGSAERREKKFDQIPFSTPTLIRVIPNVASLTYLEWSWRLDWGALLQGILLGRQGPLSRAWKALHKCGPACRASVNAPHTGVGVAARCRSCVWSEWCWVFQCVQCRIIRLFLNRICIIIMVQGTLFQTCGAYI